MGSRTITEVQGLQKRQINFSNFVLLFCLNYFVLTTGNEICKKAIIVSGNWVGFQSFKSVVLPLIVKNYKFSPNLGQ